MVQDVYMWAEDEYMCKNIFLRHEGHLFLMNEYFVTFLLDGISLFCFFSYIPYPMYGEQLAT